ncbi:MAG: ribosome biogenesis GTP-binding protein YihA/YsxC [Burkholderiaceae bacterium]
MLGAAANPDADQRAALAWARTARFVVTASRIEQLPPPGLPEVAFVGRSNAGKSTAINTLAQHRRLAFASKTPGRTQHINLFELGPAEAPDALWADLPGYGFAAVAREAKLRWQQVMADYLAHRPSLAGVVMMVDARHGFTALDRQLLAFIAPRVASGEVRLLVLLTKADKLGRADGRRALAQAQQVLGEIASEHADIGLTLFSALSREGVADVASTLRSWTGVAPA